jgi:RNA polymerase sigma factor (sigma-70 family)
VALNLCYDRLRRRRDSRRWPNRRSRSTLARPPTAACWPGRPACGVSAALAELPDRQREAVTLCHYQELTNIEAAALMGVTVDALESLLARGRRALRAALADLRE